MATTKLLNYTTTVSAEKTVAEIQAKLAAHGASQILHEYDVQRRLTGLSFKIRTKFGELAFQMPANVAAVHAVLVKQSRRGCHIDQATRVAWRILKDWVEAQLALLQTGQVTVEQVFMAFIQDPKTGRTVYDSLVEKRFAGLTIEDKKT